MDNQTTGAFIASRRKALGLSQKQLAEQLHITDKAVSKWETGRGAPDISNLLPLCEILEVSVAELLNGAQIEESNRQAQSDQVIVENMRNSARKNKKQILRTSIIVALVVALVTSAVNVVWHAYWGRRHSVLYTVNTVYVYRDDQTENLYHLTYNVTVRNWKTDFVPHTYKLKDNLKGAYGGLRFTGESEYFTSGRQESSFQIKVDFEITNDGDCFPVGMGDDRQITEAIRLSQFMAFDKADNPVESAALYMSDNSNAEIVFVYQGGERAVL